MFYAPRLFRGKLASYGGRNKHPQWRQNRQLGRFARHAIHHDSSPLLSRLAVAPTASFASRARLGVFSHNSAERSFVVAKRGHAYKKASPQRWDIIVFHPPAAATREATVWPLRVVGLPGERISIESDGIHIDGKLVRQPDSIRDIRYIASDPRVQSAITFPFTIPSDSYFVLGDNTTDSFDSRFWGSDPEAEHLGASATQMRNLSV